MEQIKEKFDELLKRLEALSGKLDFEKIQQNILKLQSESMKTGFWDDRQKAEKIMQELAEDTKLVDQIDNLQKRIEAAQAMLEPELKEELESEIHKVTKELDRLELDTYLSGFYDKNNAILSVHAGQGGVEAMDWAEILERMYLRYAERHGWKADVVDITSGEEAGIKSVTITIDGRYAYGYLRNEAGVHRLVRQSPFNADRLRQTSFALVEVLPQVEESQEIEIAENDLEWEFFRSSGHGGQNVQKVSTAVRLRHKPSQIVVTAQTERYQEQNRKIALSLLRAKLWAREQEKLVEEEKKLKGEYKVVGWGNQIRSYVLHPYKMVKDLRTGFESNEPDKILDGELDGFIDAELQLG